MWVSSQTQLYFLKIYEKNCLKSCSQNNILYNIYINYQVLLVLNTIYFRHFSL